MNTERFKLVEGSESGHCCFEATVTDTKTPHPHYKGSGDWVCECFDEDSAKLVVGGLNLLGEIENWLVCGAIATPEDMAQSFEHFQQRIADVLRTGDSK